MIENWLKIVSGLLVIITSLQAQVVTISIGGTNQVTYIVALSSK